MTAKAFLRRFLGKARRHLQVFWTWYSSPIGKPKPVYNHNQKKIEYTDQKPIIEISARLVSEDARKIMLRGNSNNPSYAITFDKTCAQGFLECNESAQVRALQIDYMKIYDKDGLNIKETLVGEPAILTTRLLNKELEK